MLETVLAEVNNWFAVDSLAGTFAVEGGRIDLPHGFLADGQYYRIEGSVFNDGLHMDDDHLTDETFDGVVTALAIPNAVIDLAGRIKSWNDENEKASMSPFASQSDQGTSVTMATGSSGRFTWRDAFRSELRRWRKL